MTSFFNAIRRELDQSARIDGCNRFTTLTLVVLPIAMPGIAATGIYVFVTAWNEFLYAAVLTGTNGRTIPLALQNMIGEYKIAWGLLNAGGVISALPVLLLFFFVQKQLISGMTAGAVKGQEAAGAFPCERLRRSIVFPFDPDQKHTIFD